MVIMAAVDHLCINMDLVTTPWPRPTVVFKIAHVRWPGRPCSTVSRVSRYLDMDICCLWPLSVEGFVLAAMGFFVVIVLY